MAEDRAKESQLWAWLKSGVAKLGRPAHVHRIEDVTKSGTPDVEGVVENGRAFWCELKVAYEQPTRGTVRVKTTVHQVYFALRRRKAGGLSWYLIRVGTGRDVRHYLVDGCYAEELLDKPVPVARLAELTCCRPSSSAAEIIMAASQAI